MTTRTDAVLKRALSYFLLGIIALLGLVLLLALLPSWLPRPAGAWPKELISGWESSDEAHRHIQSVAWGDWDNDGDLDLAVGGVTGSRVFANSDGDLTVAWTSPYAAGSASSVDWGDWDNDGDLDLAVGAEGTNWVYTNTGGSLVLAWTSVETEYTTSLDWGDWDNDGDLDLAVANITGPSRVYTNTGGSLVPAWSTPGPVVHARSVAWGDWDNDGDLDLAVGNRLDWSETGWANHVYANDGGSLTLAWTSLETDITNSLAWGDWDNDGDLDLAVGNWGQPNRVYANGGGSLTLAWSSPEELLTTSVAWGDLDNDGNQDLAAVNDLGRQNQVYLSDSGGMRLVWVSTEEEDSRAVAWGDWDSDGDADLVVGNNQWIRSVRIYVNGGGNLAAEWSSAETDDTLSLAWGDWDNDGNLDLAVGNDGANRVYANSDGVLTLAWSAPITDTTRGVAWGDWDNDGDLDLAVGNYGEPNYVYANSGGELALAWSSIETDDTTGVAWGDWDNDNDLDLAVSNEGQSNRVYANGGGSLALGWSSLESDDTTGVDWGDWDDDGDLDLAVGNAGQPNRVYANSGGGLSLAWSSAEEDDTRSVAWGDWDDDGDPDLAAGNWGQVNRVYANSGGGLALTWSCNEAEFTSSLLWGDWDGDGDLDLAVGNYGQPNVVYDNNGGRLTPTQPPAEADGTRCLALGDADGDGDLDLAVGNDSYQPNRLYLNATGLALAWSSIETDTATSVAWGDWDGDGDLDLVVGNTGQPNRVYASSGDNLTLAWSSPEADDTTSVAWGDWDGDGDLDLAVGNAPTSEGIGGQNRVYHNNGTSLVLAWSSTETNATAGVAWGDYDHDGDLDLAVGNKEFWAAGLPVDRENQLYTNVGGDLVLTWSSAETDDTRSVAWGDWDNDGDLDLAVGNSDQVNRVYANNGLALSLAWTSLETDDTRSVAWGDWDSDGDLDLAVGNNGYHAQPNRVCANEGGALTLAWTSAELNHTNSVVWADWDGDGDLDLAVGSNGINRVYANGGGDLTPTWSSPVADNINGVAWGDWDNDGDLDLAAATVGQSIRVYRNRSADIQVLPDTATRVHIDTPGGDVADFFYSATILQGPTVPITCSLTDPEGDPARYIRAYYSLDGGALWHPAVAAGDPVTVDVPASPAGTAYVYDWDIFASGVSGDSDNVVFRLDAYQGFIGAGPYQHPFRTGWTQPFRVRGSQVRVVSGTLPVENALVYRLPAGEGGDYEPYRDSSGQPILTGPSGYLQGWGQIAVGDQLVALAPITATESYTLYFTNASPDLVGLQPYTVTALGVQTLTVSAENPLALFNLDVSLEWDARYDAQYLSQLEFDLQRTSEILYDWTNGQAALGEVTIYHDREGWLDAHVRIYATNRMRPNAVQGGVVSQVITDPVTTTLPYFPGQVHMGSIWNRYGDPGGSLGEDWPRTLAHELGHYAFFLDDNYLGFSETGLLVPVDSCTGTAMSDPYRDDYSEFHADADWLPGCEGTLSHQITGRSDWATIEVFYPWLSGESINTGPSGLPLAVTEVEFVEPITPTEALEIPYFYLSQDGHRVQPGTSARAFLFQGDRLVDLGRPVLDQVLARGARPGDRLCVYELPEGRLGCETISLGDEQLALVELPDWMPDLILSPVTSRTLVLTVTNVPLGLDVKARLFPVTDPALDPISLAAAADVYTGTFNASEPALSGYVQVWVDEPEPRREIVTDYSMGGNPILMRGRGILMRGRGILMRGRGAPAVSADGQVILFGDNLDLAEDEFFTLQAVTALPAPLPWTTLVGQAYRLVASPNAPNLTGASIAFTYMGNEVMLSDELWLRMYYWDGATWQQLPTELDLYHNTASAPLHGPGLYALMTAIEIPLYGPGWNNFAYPVQATRPVTQALLSLSGYYTTVYGYEASDPFDPWRIYDTTVPTYVNSLEVLEYGQGYWINVSQSITLYLKSELDAVARTDASILGAYGPPATYYGRVTGGQGFVPQATMTVTAWVNGNLCGRGELSEVGGGLVYAIHVFGDGPDRAQGCGMPGDEVSFMVDSQAMGPTIVWDNDRVHELILTPEESWTVYLPLVIRHHD
jgi:hypothetical protein